MRPWVFYVLAAAALIVGVVSFALPILIVSVLVGAGFLLFGFKLADRRRGGPEDRSPDR